MRSLVLLLAVFISFAGSAQAASTSTLDDQTEVKVTVYNQNLGLVKDTRKLALPAGQDELRFMDVAALIKPETVHVKSLNAADKFSVLEQNYEYDLINRDKLLDKYVGQKVKLLNINEYQDKKETAEAILISNNQGQVYQINDEIYLGYPGAVVLPRLPENLIAKPTLTWMYSNAQSGSQDIEVSYLTEGINWKADYVLVVNKDDNLGDLSGWVTLTNQSGATYKDAGLKLVAGKVNVAMPAVPQFNMMREDMAMKSLAGASQFVEQGMFEYHLYDLQRKTTIKENQTKQVSLLEAKGAALVKEYIVDSQGGWWYTQQVNSEQLKRPVNVVMKVKNSEQNHLGMPLPAGTVRLYKEDASGSLQFIGEDVIDHTPKDEELKLKVGEAFDIVAERKQTAFQQYSDRVYESEWEITLRNHKKEDVVVQVVEPMVGFSNWEILSSSHSYEKVDAFTLKFSIPVSKDGETKLTYRVRVKYY
jgi:hypothetical protein